MKKILPILLGLALILVLALAACDPAAGTEPTTAPSTQPTTAPTAAPTTAPTQPAPTEPVIYDLPMTSLVLTQQTEFSQDKNGSVYFTYTYPNVRLYLADEAVSNTVILDLLNRIDATRSKAESVREDAANTDNASFFYNVQYTPERIDGAILSLSSVMVSYSGAAHPNSTCAGITYDLLTGNALTLGDVLTDRCTPDVLCRLVVDALAGINSEGLLYDDFSVSVEDRFSGNYLADDGWYLSRDGLCFSFEPYEVGPYSSGIITAVIPYSQLPGYLEDACFPMERISAPGELIIENMADSSLDPYAALAEVILDPNGDALVIYTDGLLYDITIQTRGQNPTILFAADQMTPGSAILLRAGSGSNLQITYTSNGETITKPCKAA